ncbi:kinase-like protein [Xylona heveae TC161]|uniref:Kinase-like protein n=1 Tax=Xylona heveae (strain CBS 132557 / TC161) TaxID=1328760 RepID=A0A165FXJ3_XYLHT|nr:kinase-like protein [Xylona heveae TC161]KZF21506.1 kinase-like protein [Xylona heveae TC161]
MDLDALALDKSNHTFTTWLTELKKPESIKFLAGIAAEVRGEHPSSFKLLIGAFNACLVCHFENNEELDTVIRFPQPGRVRFPEEKVRKEVAVLRFIEQYASIPVPRVLGTGKCKLGPYIIMPFVPGINLSDVLQMSEAEFVLKDDIEEIVLKRAYRVMADVMVELRRFAFDRIASITENGSTEGRPLTGDMVFLAECGNIQPITQTNETFSSSRSYLQSLVAQLFRQLDTQRHDIVADEADCRRKYIARCLFKRIVASLPLEPDGPFCLACDDFRPSNVLVDEELNITAVIDWEFCYAGPLEYAYSLPFWLLLQRPERYKPNLLTFEAVYNSRLPIFLAALREAESLAIERGTLASSERLSTMMESDVAKDRFWIFYAARNNYAFDEIYWTFIHGKYFDTEREDELLEHLSDEERRNLPALVQRKMEEQKSSELADWESNEEWKADGL